MDIRGFRLITGEELIAEVLKEPELFSTDKGSNNWILKNTVQMVVVNGKDGKATYGFAEYPTWSEDKVMSIRDEHVLFSCNPLTEFSQQYDKTFGVGLILPPTRLVS